MSNDYQDFIERLNVLISQTGCALPKEDLEIPQRFIKMSVKIVSVQEAQHPESALEIHAVCLNDPVLLPEDRDDIEPSATGPWNRREVQLLVRIPIESDDCPTAQITFFTKDADADGDRNVSFQWSFEHADEPGIAEMHFHDRKTFKLDYCNVMPPDYVCAFVRLCERAYYEPQKNYFDALLRFAKEIRSDPPSAK